MCWCCRKKKIKAVNCLESHNWDMRQDQHRGQRPDRSRLLTNVKLPLGISITGWQGNRERERESRYNIGVVSSPITQLVASQSLLLWGQKSRKWGRTLPSSGQHSSPTLYQNILHKYQFQGLTDSLLKSTKQARQSRHHPQLRRGWNPPFRAHSYFGVGAVFQVMPTCWQGGLG